MSKIVFFCIPAHGHTNPTLGVVRELISRGHQVWYYSYNMMREKIESAGATFVSCDNYDMEQKLSPKDAVRIGNDLAFSTKILVDTTLALDDKVCREMSALNQIVLLQILWHYGEKQLHGSLVFPLFPQQQLLLLISTQQRL